MVVSGIFLFFVKGLAKATDRLSNSKLPPDGHNAIRKFRPQIQPSKLTPCSLEELNRLNGNILTFLPSDFEAGKDSVYTNYQKNLSNISEIIAFLNNSTKQGLRKPSKEFKEAKNNLEKFLNYLKKAARRNENSIVFENNLKALKDLLNEIVSDNNLQTQTTALSTLDTIANDLLKSSFLSQANEEQYKKPFKLCVKNFLNSRLKLKKSHQINREEVRPLQEALIEKTQELLSKKDLSPLEAEYLKDSLQYMLRQVSRYKTATIKFTEIINSIIQILPEEKQQATWILFDSLKQIALKQGTSLQRVQAHLLLYKTFYEYVSIIPPAQIDDDPLIIQYKDALKSFKTAKELMKDLSLEQQKELAPLMTECKLLTKIIKLEKESKKSKESFIKIMEELKRDKSFYKVGVSDDDPLLSEEVFIELEKQKKAEIKLKETEVQELLIRIKKISKLLSILKSKRASLKLEKASQKQNNLINQDIALLERYLGLTA